MLKENQALAHFRIIRLLGEGGMGQVYLAEDQKLHRQVALKILTADYFGDAERRERFQREARTAAQISHGNVMAIYDIGNAVSPESNQPIEYIVMEYIKGKSLSDYLKGRPHDVSIALRLAEKIASGLAAAHKIKVVHRDIKAENILVNDEEQPKILDFGLAKPVDPVQFGDSHTGTKTVSQELTKAGKILGTVTYMSPEQVKGEPLDTRSDVFSFGVLLYRMVTGEFPFAGQTQVSTLAKILETRHEPPRVKNSEVPSELERIIDKCLQKDPADRYQDTRDLVVDLRNLRRQFDSGVTDRLTSGEAQAIKNAANKQSGRSPWVNRLLIAALLVIVIGAVYAAFTGFIGGWISGGDRESSGSQSAGLRAAENSLAILGFENKTGDAQYDWLGTGLPEILLTDLAQTPSVSLISRDRILDNLGRGRDREFTHDEYIKAARNLGAARVLTGAFYKFGDSLRIDARLEDIASGKIVMGEKVVGTNPWALVDSLAAKIGASLKVQIMTTPQSGVASFASTPEAYKLYHAGMDKFGIELFDDAIVLFRKAIEVDSSFALPYMRIGMACVFQGRQQQGATYFAKAKRLESKLPVRERNLLDVYADLWLTRHFDRAFLKAQALVRDYPDDVESRTFYAMMLDIFSRDTTGAKSQLDTALQISPQFQLALSYVADRKLASGDIDGAIEYQKRIRQFHPESPAPLIELGKLYARRMQFEEAIAEYRTLLDRFPDDSRGYFNLADVYVRQRRFNDAANILDDVRKRFGTDHQKMAGVYSRLSGLDAWSGRFKLSISHMHESLSEEQLFGDSSRIANAYFAISSAFSFLDQNDSALAYVGKAGRVATEFQKLSCPLKVVAIDRSRADSVRREFKVSLEQFKSRMPSEIWPLADAIGEIFEAFCQADTAALIATSLKIAGLQTSQDNSANNVAAAELMILSGRYGDGKELLEKNAIGEKESIDGWEQPHRWYLLGRAYEGLSDRPNAVKYYGEMLRFWGNPDVEMKEIRDARARLAKLQS